MRDKYVWIIGFLLLAVSFLAFQQMGFAAQQNGGLSEEKAVKIASKWAATVSLVQAGGVYKESEYKSFPYKGTTYRYMASNLDTKKELRNELEKSVTRKIANQFIKDRKIIMHNNKLAQPEADGGSLLQWEKSNAKVLKSKKDFAVVELTVPIGDTNTVDKYKIEYEYIKRLGWRISKLPVLVK